MSELLGTDIITLDNCGFHFYKSGFICKVLEATGMDHCDGFPKIIRVEAHIGNTILYIYFAVHTCDWFTHNNNESNKTAVKRIHWYLQGTKEKGLLFNQSNKVVVNCYVDADF